LAASSAKYERALSESEKQHRAIIEEQAELVSLASADGRLRYVNPAYSRHFDKSSLEMIGTSLYDLIDPADRTQSAHRSTTYSRRDPRCGEKTAL
jgi:PAS domain S-box-containing protein